MRPSPTCDHYHTSLPCQGLDETHLRCPRKSRIVVAWGVTAATWHNREFGKRQVCNQVRTAVIDAFIALANTITTHSLIHHT